MQATVDDRHVNAFSFCGGRWGNILFAIGHKCTSSGHDRTTILLFVSEGEIPTDATYYLRKQMLCESGSHLEDAYVACLAHQEIAVPNEACR